MDTSHKIIYQKSIGQVEEHRVLSEILCSSQSKSTNTNLAGVVQTTDISISTCVLSPYSLGASTHGLQEQHCRKHLWPSIHSIVTCLTLTSSNLLLLLEGDRESDMKSPISELLSEQELGKLSVDPAELASLYESVADPAGGADEVVVGRPPEPRALSPSSAVWSEM